MNCEMTNPRLKYAAYGVALEAPIVRFLLHGLAADSLGGRSLDGSAGSEKTGATR